MTNKYSRIVSYNYNGKPGDRWTLVKCTITNGEASCVAHLEETEFNFRMWKQKMVDSKLISIDDIKELDDIVLRLCWKAADDEAMNQSEN